METTKENKDYSEAFAKDKCIQFLKHYKRFRAETSEVDECIMWLEKQKESKPLNIDIDYIVEQYKKRIVEQCNNFENNPLVSMCVTAFKTGIENTLDELKLKDFINKNEIEIPFGAKDSELEEETYFIPKGYRVEINGNKIIIKK